MNTRNFVSLDAVASCLGLETHKDIMDGSMVGSNFGLVLSTYSLIHGAIVSKHLSIGEIRNCATGKVPKRVASSSDCFTPFCDR